jgi:hypothetical protein
MKQMWSSPLGNGRDADYSIERSEQLWGITAQVHGNFVLHQAQVKGPKNKQEVEEFFRDDLMKEC